MIVVEYRVVTGTHEKTSDVNIRYYQPVKGNWYNYIPVIVGLSYSSTFNSSNYIQSNLCIRTPASKGFLSTKASLNSSCENQKVVSDVLNKGHLSAKATFVIPCG